MHPSVLFLCHSDQAPAAFALSEKFKIPLVESYLVGDLRQKERVEFYCEHLDSAVGLFFIYESDGLSLVLLNDGQLLSARADFVSPTVKYRRRRGGGRGEMIAKAIGLRGNTSLRVADVTAGLGGDAFVLASLGCSMTLVERVPAVRALLESGLSQAGRIAAGGDAGLQEIIDRMSVLGGDSIGYLRDLDEGQKPDVVYLDPMFPERKKSAAVKKEMQVFHRVVGADEDAGQLLELALESATSRVVVKRPRIADTLSAVSPTHILEGKRNRFDIYLV